MAAAHRARVLRIHVRADEIGKVRDPVLRRGLPQRLQGRVVPIEVAGDVVCRNREGKYPSGGIAVAQYLDECAIESINLVLKFAVAFLLHFASANHRRAEQGLRHDNIERNVGERRLETYASRNVKVEYELLQGLLDLVISQAVVADKRREQGIEGRECLRPRRLALQGVEKVDYLSQGAAEVPRRRARHFARDTAEAAHKKVHEVPPDAVYGQRLQVVHVEVSSLMRPAHLFGINGLQPVALADVGSDVIVESLQREGHIAVFLDLPVGIPQVFLDKHPPALLAAQAPHRGMLLSVQHVRLGDLEFPHGKKGLFHHVLHLFDSRCFLALRKGACDCVRDYRDHVRALLSQRRISTLQRHGYFVGIKWHCAPVALDNGYRHGSFCAGHGK